MSPLRVSTRRVPKADKIKLAQKALDRFRRDTGRRLPENQAAAKEEEEEEREAEAGEVDVADALSPARWTSPSMSMPLLYVCVLMFVISLVEVIDLRGSGQRSIYGGMESRMVFRFLSSLGGVEGCGRGQWWCGRRSRSRQQQASHHNSKSSGSSSMSKGLAGLLQRHWSARFVGCPWYFIATCCFRHKWPCDGPSASQIAVREGVDMLSTIR